MKRNNDIIFGKVSEVNRNWILFDIDEEYTGFLHISKITDYFVSNLNNTFKIGDELTMKILFIKNKTFYLDFKNERPLFLKNPFSFDIKETEKGFKNLLNFTKGEIKAWVQ
ncbi:MAG: S1 RNA-binding domain-containing protein [Metamycoplasmataceae bacterium]